MTVPNSDCWESVDWEALKKAVQDAMDRKDVDENDGNEEKGSDEGETSAMDKNLGLDGSIGLDKVSAENMARWRADIPSMLSRLSRDFDLVFVEGFLLALDVDSLFEVGFGLFLPTARDVSKKRRFARWEYVDHPQGGRMKGQSWKTEAYFDQVVRKEAEKVGEKVKRMIEGGMIDFS